MSSESGHPTAHRLDLVEEIHGRRVADPYRWLEDPADPATIDWLAAQNRDFRRVVEGVAGRDRLRARAEDLLAIGSVSPPVWAGERRFFLRRTAGQDHAVLHLLEPDGDERVLLDPMAVDPTGATTLDSWRPDPEGRQLAYQLSTGGDEASVLYVLDVVTGETVDGPIDRCRYSPVAWLPGAGAFYYVRRLPPDRVPSGEAALHRKVFLHQVGKPATEDVLVFGEGEDRTAYYGLAVSHDGRWLSISVTRGAARRNDLWLADLRAAPAHALTFRAVQRDAASRTLLSMGPDGLAYLLTNRDAPRGRLAVADPDDPAYDRWRTLIPEDGTAVLADAAILDGAGAAPPALLAVWTRHAVSEITVHDLVTGARLGQVPTPGLGTVGGLTARPDGGHEAWFTYTDSVTPVSVWHFDARTGETALWAATPGRADTPGVEARQLTCASKDGTPVRVLVVARPGDGAPRPTILTGYGAFGVSMQPSYSPEAMAWIDAGGVWATAMIRGGGEEGAEWHRAGARTGKQNSFDDFCAAAERLVADGWTTPRQLGIFGGSNGGLVVGAALTQRPELFAAAVALAPLLDMVRYERSGLGPTWTAEYGSVDDPDGFAVLHAYSPYHRVRSGVDYPATMLAVFDNDTRVDPMHARKMCAALRHATAGARPIVLRHESGGGHGRRAVSRGVALIVDILGFMAAHTGLDLGAAPR